MPVRDFLPPEILACVIGWARVSPGLTWKHPGLPQQWTPVLSNPPEHPTRRALPGWVFLFFAGQVKEIDQRALEYIPGIQRPG